MLEFKEVRLDHADAQSLIATLNQELDDRYPEEGANHFRLDADEVGEGRGVFLIGYREGKPLACGALRKLADGAAEIKRMFVSKEARGLGLGARILQELEAKARKLNIRRLVLETGERQVEAVGLYRKAGFARIERFGDYVDSPLSLCLGKDLDDGDE